MSYSLFIKRAMKPNRRENIMSKQRFTYQIKSTIEVKTFEDNIKPGEVLYSSDDGEDFATKYDAYHSGLATLQGLDGSRGENLAHESAEIDVLDQQGNICSPWWCED